MKAVIFDFDGTLADTIPEMYAILENLSEEFHYTMVSKKETNRLRGMTILQILKAIKFPLWKFPFLVKRTREELHKKIPVLKPIQGIRPVLHHLKKKGYTMGIVSSSTKDLVLQFLTNNSLLLFDFVYTGSSLFGKERKIKQALKQYGLLPNETMCVGDEVRDIEAAKKLHMKIISVTWGFNTKKGLYRYKPDYMVDSPKELLDIL